MTFRIFAYLYLLLAMVACDDSAKKTAAVKPGREEIENLNRFMVAKDRERILGYIERKGLMMTETPTGLWFQVLREGQGSRIEGNGGIVMDYECSLLDGTICYSSVDLGPKKIVLGKTQVEPGMYEGLRMLRYGAEAIFILPPYMAYGMPGDGKLIPPRSVVVYKVHILPTEME